jgi:uncharacterized phage protein (TIGR02218 family)
MRTVTPALQLHLDQAGTTAAWYLKIRSNDGRTFGMTSNNVALTYDIDGAGDVTYQPAMDIAGFNTTAALEVDNNEATVLINITETFSEQDIDAGVLDFGQFWLYRMNWAAPEEGFYIADYGSTGITTADDHLAGIIQLRGISQTLKQSFVTQSSRTCRAVFGSQAGQAGVILACQFDAEPLWVEGLVTAVDSEDPDQVFIGNYGISTGPNGVITYETSLIQWQSGSNTGAYIETETVEDVITDGAVELLFPMARSIQVGDTFRIRPDCAKRAKEDCIDKFDNYQWFRGEATIPVAGESSSHQPGANVPGLGSGIVPGLRIP